MEQYLEKGKEVLKILINNGCEAYMIGEAVTNLIKGSPFSRIDITTNATPDMVKGIFSNTKVEDKAEGAVRLTYMGYTFVVRTFRLEEKFKDNRKPLRLHYSKNLKDELAACDFTINAIAMSYGGKLTDAYRGYDDIRKKRIRTIGSPRVRFSENPMRILIAIRLSSELGFKIERRTLVAMKKKARLLKKIDPSLMEEELRSIFSGKNFKRGLYYIVESKAYKYISELSRGLNHLSKNYKRLSIDSILACSYVLNKKHSNRWDNLSDDPERLEKVVELALLNPRSKYDSYLLLKFGLEVTLDSNYVNYMLRRSRNKNKKIRKQYQNLPIKDINEIKFSKADFLRLSLRAEEYYDVTFRVITTKILNGELENDFNTIRLFAINALSLYNIEINEQPKIPREFKEYSYQEEMDEFDPVFEERFVKPEPCVEDNTPVTTFEQVQRKVSEFEKTLREKDEKIKALERQALENKLDNDINNIVGQNLEMLRDLNYLEKGSEKLMFSRELKEVYRGLIKNTDPRYRALSEKKEGNEIKDENED